MPVNPVPVTPTTVIGVLPRSFDFGAVFSPGAKVDALTPLNLYGPPRDWGNIITFIGRLKPGVSLAQATEDAATVAPKMCWNNKNPDTCGQYKGAVVPVPLKDYISGKLRRASGGVINATDSVTGARVARYVPGGFLRLRGIERQRSTRRKERRRAQPPTVALA